MLALGNELMTRRLELAALRNQDITQLDDGTLRVLIRRNKADPYGEGAHRLHVTAHRRSAAGMAGLPRLDIAWLFCPIYQRKQIDRCLETTTVRRVILEAAQR